MAGFSESRGTTTDCLPFRALGLTPDTGFVGLPMRFGGVTGFGEAGAADRAAFCLRGATVAFAAGVFLVLAAAVRVPDWASFASASARASRASARSALACLACFLARRAMSLASLRLRLATRACSLAAFHRFSAVATRRRAVWTLPASCCESVFESGVFIIARGGPGGPVGPPSFLNPCAPGRPPATVKLEQLRHNVTARCACHGGFRPRLPGYARHGRQRAGSEESAAWHGRV